jgi:hypothetical protein
MIEVAPYGNAEVSGGDGFAVCHEDGLASSSSGVE